MFIYTDCLRLWNNSNTHQTFVLFQDFSNWCVLGQCPI